MTASVMRAASIALGLLGVVGQLGVAFMGDAIGGPSLTVLVLVFDAVVASIGAVLVFRWLVPGLTLMAVAGLGASVALFFTTLLEIGVAFFLLCALIAGLLSTRGSVRGLSVTRNT